MQEGDIREEEEYQEKKGKNLKEGNGRKETKE
jgi:hypothetical protein